MHIKKLFLKIFLISLPFIILVSLYYYFDPFKVVRNYDSYFTTGKPSYIVLNKDYVSLENWLNKYDKYNYDSYIFGNSRTLFYEIDTWKNYIHSESEKCYHFDASSETLFGIERKLKLLDDRNVPIKNALIMFDNFTLNGFEDSDGHLYMKHPLETGKSKLAFQLEYFKTFLNTKFFFTYADFKLSDSVKPYMKADGLIDERPMEYDPVTNEIKFKYYEDMINANPDSYYGPRKKIFYRKDTVETKSGRVINNKEKIELLTSIKNILAKNNTDYKIIIHPIFDLIKFNDEDLKFLKELFGSDRVFDFSGLNSLTVNVYNFYDGYHYRPQLADSIMSIIYTGK